MSDAQFHTLIELLRPRGWRLLDFGLLDGTGARDANAIGAVVTRLPSDPLVRGLRESGLCLVRMGRLEHPEDDELPAVLPALRDAGRLAADHLAERGFRHLAVFGHEAMEIARLIASGVEEQAQATGATCQRLFLSEDSRRPASGEPSDAAIDPRSGEITRWLRELPKPVGVVAANPYYAATLNLACLRAGLTVPEEVALVSIGDDVRRCETASVPLSAVDLARVPMARTAIDLLERLIAGEAVPPRTYVPPSRVITRRSTDILAVDHPLVARTIRYMWDRLEQDLSVDQIAVAMDTPRSTLERLFRQHFSRGIHAELRRARLEHCAELLRTTRQPLREIAPQVGFKDPKFLHTAFCKTYGTTPRKYRLKAG